MKVICWWSGGITSAVACKVAIDLYGKDNCEVIMIDTHNEHSDTYRFKDDCSKWYGLPIKTISAIGGANTQVFRIRGESTKASTWPTARYAPTSLRELSERSGKKKINIPIKSLALNLTRKSLSVH